jgi:chemotaxis protein MotB
VSGYADTRPIDTNDTPGGRAKNRRIEVIIDGGK